MVEIVPENKAMEKISDEEKEQEARRHPDFSLLQQSAIIKGCLS